MPDNIAATAPVILITGKEGQVGWELHRSLAHIGHVVACGSRDMDLSDPDRIVSVVREVQPDIIVNSAAYTAVDKAEEEPELAMKINGVAPGILAEEARRIGAFMIHYSTDYVFNGEKSLPYTEDDDPDPINTYGFTKLQGDDAVRASGINHLIFRTSWVYAARGRNFLRSMLSLARHREALNIVDDQTGTPTWARMVAEVSMHALVKARSGQQDGCFESGLYNLVPSGHTSWYGFAEKIFDIARNQQMARDLIIRQLHPVPASQYSTSARRPMNSRLARDKLERSLGTRLPAWDVFLDLCMRDMSAGSGPG